MIGPDYARIMARYNAWQNDGLIAAVGALDAEALSADRGAFFGSIMGTLSHLLWGDTIWMSRFTDAVAKPSVGIPASPAFLAEPAAWRAARAAMDETITDWARGLGPDDLSGDLAWYSGALGRDVLKPKTLCVMHFFNHQTHHRGQVHAMLTAAGHLTAPTDLFAMREPA